MTILGPDGLPLRSDTEAADRNQYPKHHSEFVLDIWKLVIDKLLIGLVLGIAALIASYFLDVFKSETTLNKELSFLRANKIGETWEGIYVLESTYLQATSEISDTYIRARHRAQLKRKYFRAEEARVSGDSEAEDKLLKEFKVWQKEMGQTQLKIRAIEKKYSDKLKEAKLLLAQNRFWLGSDQHSVATDFVAIFSTGSAPTSDEASFKSFMEEKEKELENGRLYVQKFRKQLLNIDD